MVDFTLSDEQKDLREMAHNFAEKEMRSVAFEYDKDGTWPAEVIQKAWEVGLMNTHVDEAYGGPGLDYLSGCLIEEEFGWGCSGIGTSLACNGLASAPVALGGSEETKAKYLGMLCEEPKLASFCLTEPDAGSDAASIRTRAKLDGDHYVLNGAKQFITSGKNAKVAIVFAVTDPEKGKGGLSAFIVPTDTPGFRVERVELKLGQHSSDTCAIVFENMRVPVANRLGAEGMGLKIALANLEGGRIGIAAQAVGMARAAFEAARDYAKERKQFGKPIFDHQAVAFKLADMATRIDAAELMVMRAAVLKDAGLPCLKEASMAKLFASEMAEQVCSDAIQIHGGYGYLADYPVERIYRDVRVCQIYEGTSEVQRLVIARALAAG